MEPRPAHASPSTDRVRAFSLDSGDERFDLGARAQVVNALRGSAFGDEVAIFRSERRVAAPDDPVAAHGAAPDRAVGRPALWCREEPADQTFGDPPVMGDQRKID